MRTTPREREEVIGRLARLGIDRETADKLRRISLALHSWSERECGVGGGCIERDEKTGLTYWLSEMTGRRFRIPDRETGALKRLGKIMENLPGLLAYQQGDPRGCALYILRTEDVRDGESVDSVYSRGVAVY